MVSTCPDQLSGDCPSTNEARTAALRNFKPTKQDLEEAWAKENAQNPRTKFRAKQLAEFIDGLGITFPTVLWVIVAGYTIVPTWLDVE